MNFEKLSINEPLGLFRRAPEQTRWLSFADSEGYLAVVLSSPPSWQPGSGWLLCCLA